MTPHTTATTFHVSDLERSLRYYIDVLGFTERFRFGDYAGVQMGSEVVQIHLSGPVATNKRAVGQGSLYVFCDTVDAYAAEIADRGAASESEQCAFPCFKAMTILSLSTCQFMARTQ